MTIAYLMAVMNSMGVIIPPWSMVYTHTSDLTKDEKAIRDAYNVGYLLVETIKTLKSRGVHIGYKPGINVEDLAKLASTYLNHVRGERELRIKYLESIIEKNKNSQHRVFS